MSARLEVLARSRLAYVGGGEIVAVRWATSARDPFPESGFVLKRYKGSSPPETVCEHRLPGAVLEAGMSAWTIDFAALENDRVARLSHAQGAQFPDPDTARMLCPVMAFALARPSESTLALHLEGVAMVFDQSHRTDVGLDERHWHGTPPASYADLLAYANGGPAQLAAYLAVIDYYQTLSRAYLSFLASDFGMATFLGLAINDIVQGGDSSDVLYSLEAMHDGQQFIARTRVDRGGSPWPKAPQKPEVIQLDSGTAIGYPAYAPFFGPTSKWAPIFPASLQSSNGASAELFDQLVEAAKRGPRHFTSPVARISWKADSPSYDDREGPNPLLSRDAYFWRIERHAFGAVTAADSVEPQVPPTLPFSTCHGGEYIVRTEENSFDDDIDLPYGDPPLEGWIAYRVCGIDLFGIEGPVSIPGLVRLRDNHAPPPPRVRADITRVDLPDSGALELNINLDWESPHEYQAPDAAQFRIRQIWTPVEHVPLEVVSVAPIMDAHGNEDALNAVQVDVELVDASGKQLGDELLAKLSDGTLLTPIGEFAVLSHSSPSRLRVRRSVGRAPPKGGAAVRFAHRAVEGDHVASFERVKAKVGAVRLRSVEPLCVHLWPQDGGPPITPEIGKVHFHLLGHSFSVAPTDDKGCFQVVAPDPDDQRGMRLLREISALPVGEAEEFLRDSPALFLPPHPCGLTLRPPDGFSAGTLRVAVSTADGCPYVQDSDGRPGNEGVRAELVLVAFGSAVPKPVNGRIDRVWASGAAEFVELASVIVSWGAMRHAVRYDVERAFESALGCSLRSTDEALISAGMSPSADAAFVRVSSSVFLPRIEDSLPGRAPTRVLYRVRGVSSAGSAGDWQIVALVRVPDVRIPPRPSLMTSAPDPVVDRVITCAWTQPGPLEGIGFELQVRDVMSDAHPNDAWETVADFLPGALAPSLAKRFHATVANRPPGRWQEFRVLPIRHALDPSDPRAARLRKIPGPPSNLLRVRAKGVIRAPSELRATVSSDGWVTLRWRNTDAYDVIEIRRRAPGRSGYERRQLPGDTEHFREPEILPAQGAWRYELVGLASGRRVVSDPKEFIWGVP